MPKTIAVVGAGPGVGMAVAARFAREGYRVALLARNLPRLRQLAARLGERGFEAEAFEADVLDRGDLAASLELAASRLGPVDVLEYSPLPPMASMRRPRDIDADNELFHLDFQVLGAIAAVRTVLPGMLERRSGSLLFTTAPSATRPILMTASFGIAAGGLLNYVRLLHRDLSGDGVYAGIVSVAGVVVSGDPAEDDAHAADFPPGIPFVPAADIADLHWRLHAERNRVYADAGDDEALIRIPGMN
jgi:NADP-dependent 3-hydroxy acid dehydrogenase YdfG